MAIGLGLAAVGRPGYINLGRAEDLGGDRSPEALERHAHSVLDAAYDAGVRYFDAARSYGRAEDFLASWLRRRGIEPGAVEVASKWGYEYTAGWRVDADEHEVKDLSLDHYRRQLAETRARLGGHLTLYQIHSATLESGVLDDGPLLAELAELRAGGVKVGLTTTGPQQAATIDRAVELGGFDAVQATWNLLEPSAGEALARAHAAGMRVVVKEAVANGRLAGRERQPALERAAARAGATPDAVAIAAALAQPWAGVVLSGAATVDQVRSNLAAVTLTLDEVPDLAIDPDEYWRARSELAWS
jgi:aryl-alcohol dehydrogenase-like predicted oxidoreductase